MKYIIYLLIALGFTNLLSAQTSTENYIQSKTYTKNDNSTAITQIQYYDGLGRPIETVQKGITSNSKDLVTLTEYDGVGREQYQWLPKTMNGSGAFVNPTTFKNTVEPLYNGDSNPFTETVYEQSPLNRVKEQFGAGNAWKTANKRVTTDYDTNIANEVKYFYVNANNQLANGGYYAANTLYKTTTKDEDGKPAAEYKDKLGRVVMKRRGINTDTYYVYNDLGQLAYVLPPLAADANGSVDAVNKYGYVYKYDERGNCIYKKLPGCEPIYMVYDKADRLILSQDGNQRMKNKWTVNKYDYFGRVLYVSEVVTSTSYIECLNNFKNWLVIEQFSTGALSYPMEDTGYSRGYYHIAPTRLLTVNYYDDYQFLKTLTTSGIDTTKIAYSSKAGYSNRYTSPPGGKIAAGLLTGTRTYLLDGSGKYTVTALYYDDKGHIVQTRSTNHLGGYDIVYNDLDFTGKPNKTLKEHNIAVNGIQQPVVSELYTYTYDHAGRMTKTIYQLNNQTAITLTDMTASGSYDELGRAKNKKRHNGTDAETYTYNIRNWITQINSGNSLIENLYYNTNPLNTNVCYNGNISFSTWTYGTTSVSKGYTYRYDEHNRLLNSVFQQGTSTQTAGSFDEDFTYDKMGNILTIKRKKDNTLIDDLTLNYTGSGNQLTYVNDAAGSQNLSTVKEYQDKSNTASEFAYDANGNMIKDLDRDIHFIKYNLLNLPDTIQFKNGSQIINRYDAGGQKLSVEYLTYITQTAIPLTEGKVNKWVYDATKMTLTGTAYDGNMEYTSAVNGSGIKSYIYSKTYNAEGYSQSLTGISYYYFRKDHLGNNRAVWLANNNTTVQRTQYYPSGLPWAEGEGTGVQNKKYNGKEWIEMHGLDEFDYGARGMFPAIGRFTTVDPLAEKYYSISPYAYCAGNPVNRIDPEGMDWYSYQEKYQDKDGKEQIRTSYKYVKGEMSEKEMKEGGFTHLGQTYDDGNGTYFSLGGSEIKYSEKDPISSLAVNRLKGADNTIIATVNAYKSVSKNVSNFWDKYNEFISSGSSAASIVSGFMELSKGIKGSINAFGRINSGISAYNDFKSYQAGTLKGEKLLDAAINIVSLAGTPGAAISLLYYTVAKPGAKAIIKTETMLRTNMPNLIINANNGYWPY